MRSGRWGPESPGTRRSLYGRGRSDVVERAREPVESPRGDYSVEVVSLRVDAGGRGRGWDVTLLSHVLSRPSTAEGSGSLT